VADWSAGAAAAAAERILDAAAQLFSRHDADTVGMNEIARAAGCSRATLYRYFENRDALHTAFVHREAHRVFAELGDQLVGVADPRQRLLFGVLAALRMVRQTPALASWFTPTTRPVGGELADRSDVINALVEGFLRSLGVERAELRARWLVRVMISLLMFPGHDEAQERAMLEEFVLPTLTTSR
jgi:AcrR family transcriptional regulator